MKLVAVGASGCLSQLYFPVGGNLPPSGNPFSSRLLLNRIALLREKQKKVIYFFARGHERTTPRLFKARLGKSKEKSFFGEALRVLAGDKLESAKQDPI